MAMISAPRYHRRVLVVGLLAAALLYGIGAPIFANRIESDLEQRVPEALTEAGFPEVTASFDGQDGTLVCVEPLRDPAGATEVVYDVWGVRSVELDRSCRVLTSVPATSPENTSVASDDATDDDRAGDVGTGDEGTGGTTTDGSTTDDSMTDDSTTDGSNGDASTEGDSNGSSTASGTSVPEPDFATVGELIATDPQFSLLAVLMEEAGLTTLVDDENVGPATVFAATDEAFDSLAADELARLRSDSDLLARVLRHHAIVGRLAVADLTTGPYEALDGDVVDVVVSAGGVTVDDASVVDADIEAGNGIVHAIDRVLMPDGIDLVPQASTSVLSATYVDGTMTYVGVVTDEAGRATLSDALADPVIVDVAEIDVDAAQGRGPADVDRLAQLAAVMPDNLTSGVAGFDESELSISGVYVTEAGRDAVVALAESVGATHELAGVPPTTDAQAQELEDALNAVVAGAPILFGQRSAQPSSDSQPVLQQIADLIGPLTDVTVTVEGHTDSDGDPDDNLALSESRAQAIRLTLIGLGVPAANLEWEGLGSGDPILVDGVEDKPASRRIEFRVDAPTT